MTLKKRKIRSLLVANRGEIAVRILRACSELGIRSVAVYSDVDRSSLHVRMADYAYALHGTTATETYLEQEKLIEIARQANVDAIHPGYGFLSENSNFADRVEKEGFIFVGPPSAAIRLLGDKTKARRLARELGIPTVAGASEAIDNDMKALELADEIGFPLLLKAAAGGGGKGMRVVRKKEEFAGFLHTARSEARSAFGDDRVYVEKYMDKPRHLEIQLLADNHGNIISLGERECSIQRRHQKVIEESPSMAVTEPMRKQMSEAAIAFARHAGYKNAGTVEFLVDEARKFYFLEVNTRLQVEHPVTELRTGIDIVKEQLSIAEGNRLSLAQDEIQNRGHALECRIYAEDPAHDFFPSTGVLHRYRLSQGPQVRLDNGSEEGGEVSVYFDPLLCKVVTWGNTRNDAIGTMKRSLHESEIQGIQTTIPFCLFVLDHKEFVDGNYTTKFVEEHFESGFLRSNEADELMAAAVGALLIRLKAITNAGSGRTFSKNGSQWKKLRTETYRS